MIENEKKKTTVYVTQQLEDAVLDAAHRRRIRGGWQGAVSAALEEWSSMASQDDLTPEESRAVSVFIQIMRKRGSEMAMRLAAEALDAAETKKAG